MIKRSMRYIFCAMTFMFFVHGIHTHQISIVCIPNITSTPEYNTRIRDCRSSLRCLVASFQFNSLSHDDDDDEAKKKADAWQHEGTEEGCLPACILTR